MSRLYSLPGLSAAEDKLKVVAAGRQIAFRLDRADLLSWLAQTMPVILILYDGRTDRAYWLYVQAHFEKQKRFAPARMKPQVTVRIPAANALNPQAIRRFAEFRARICRQAREVVHHEEE